MVKEYVDHERAAQGQKPCPPAQLYRANPRPDWWPAGVEVRARVAAAWGRLLLSGRRASRNLRLPAALAL